MNKIKFIILPILILVTSGCGDKELKHKPAKHKMIKHDKKIKKQKKDMKHKVNKLNEKKHKEIKCDIIFDSTLFSTKIKVDVKNLTGLDEIIQQSIINHNMFDMIMEKIITEIEESNPKIIGIVCNYGKHRSVGWAELIKKFYYKNTIINHIGLK